MLKGQLEDVVRHALLEVQDAPAVRKCPRWIAVGDPARELVGEEKAEPDCGLAEEVDVTAGENAASGCDSGAHQRASNCTGRLGAALSRGRVTRRYPPICDIDRDAGTNPGSLTRCLSSL